MAGKDFSDDTSKGEDRAGPVILLVIIVAAAYFSWQRHADLSNRDALSIWMAAQAWSVGAWDQIYAPIEEVFRMRPPQSWYEAREAIGDFEPVYPYLYPPLWSALLAPLTETISFEQFTSFLAFFNPLVLGAAVAVAARLCVPSEARPAFVLAGVVYLACTTVGLVALEQNQPQIVVSALTVLAGALMFMGQSVASGAVLALAASLKLSPALFVIVYLARGDTRALGGFLLTGSALGFASLYVAGWPLHAQLLETVSTISASVLHSSLTFSVDPVIAERFFSDRFELVLAVPGSSDGVGWRVLAKPTWWRLFDAALLIGALTLAFRTARRFNDVLVWPFTVVILSLAAPLSWSYHYLAAFVFIPVLFWRLPVRTALLVMVVLFLPLSIWFNWVIFATEGLKPWVATLGTVPVAFYAFVLYQAMVQADRA